MSLSPSANIVTSHVASHRRGASWQSSYELVPAIDVTRPASRGERITRPVSPPYTSTDEDMEGEEDPATPLRSQKCCPTCGSRQEKGSKQKLIARGIWSPTVFCLLAIVVVLLMLYYVRSKGNQYLATDFGEFCPVVNRPESNLLRNGSTSTSTNRDPACSFQRYRIL